MPRRSAASTAQALWCEHGSAVSPAASGPCMAQPLRPCAPADTPLVDVADIATAHCLAMVTKEAHGAWAAGGGGGAGGLPGVRVGCRLHGVGLAGQVLACEFRVVLDTAAGGCSWEDDNCLWACGSALFSPELERCSLGQAAYLCCCLLPGRYIVCSGTWMATELADILRWEP